ncbi:MAG: zinc ribbon domain-containing protein [Candidatus Omnitrophota bacterium]|nr:MAG: zinc ribbon domain-containing protein [Candidatus Omnitrophota bacterium]
MPTYEYECCDCSHKFEVFQKMSEKPLSDCPQCKGKLRRLISNGAGLIFKGSGFYATDYKKGSSVSEEKKPTPSCTENCPMKGECGK